MNDNIDRQDNPASPGDGNSISPLPGEPGIPDVAARTRTPVSKKGLFALALLVISLVLVSAFSIDRFVARGKKPDDGESKRAGDRPSAATADPRRLDMSIPPSPAASTSPRVPALVPTAEESADPIGVRRTADSSNGGAKSARPEDAPAMLVTSRPGADHQVTTDAAPTDPTSAATRNLQGYQRQLQGMLDSLGKTTSMATGAIPQAAGLTGPSPAAPGLFGGQLQGSDTPRVSASLLGNRSLTLPKGTAFTCALKTKVISAASGMVGCQVQRNVFSDDGRVLLIERGSHMDGEYHIGTVRPGMVRIPVLWTRIRTPNGVVVNIDSPGTGPLGESGIDGYVDNRWSERIGAAMLLSLIDDSVKLLIQNGSNDSTGNTFVLPSTTSSTSKLAEKVLDSTINIPPLIYQNQGGIVGIYVARDVDFSSVYELKPVMR